MIVEFLEGTGIDNHGRRLDQVVAEDDEYWEHTHNFIQWLFPLDEKSRSVRGSPVLEEEHMRAIRESESARTNLQRSVTRYKDFLAGRIYTHDTDTHIIQTKSFYCKTRKDSVSLDS